MTCQTKGDTQMMQMHSTYTTHAWPSVRYQNTDIRPTETASYCDTRADPRTKNPRTQLLRDRVTTIDGKAECPRQWPRATSCL